MVAKRRAIAGLLAVFLLGPSLTAVAESRQIVTIDAIHSLTRVDDNDWSLAGLGLVEVDIQSTENRQARGQLRVTGQASADGSSQADIDRAFVKVRFPFFEERWFHLTAGRARLSWGDGAYFNAADTLYGRRALDADFTEETLRDESSWLLAAFLPLGPFSFVEPVVLAPGVDLLSEAPTPPGVENTAAGLRIQGKIGGLKAEASYLYDGDLRPVHRPAVSLQGNLGVDWYLSASTAFPDAPKEEAALSVGLFHVHRDPRGRSLSLRLESLLLPWQRWAAASEGLDPGDSYGVTLFPEIVWSPNSTLSVYLRSLISPIDLSARLTPGVRWNAVEGVSLYTFVSGMLGEQNDVYAFGRPGGLAFVTGIELVY